MAGIVYCECTRNMPYYDWSHAPECPLYVRLERAAEPAHIEVAPGQQDGATEPEDVGYDYEIPEEAEYRSEMKRLCGDDFTMQAGFQRGWLTAQRETDRLRAALTQALSLFPPNEVLIAITPDDAMEVRLCPARKTPKVADVIRWRAALAASRPGKRRR